MEQTTAEAPQTSPAPEAEPASLTAAPSAAAPADAQTPSAETVRTPPAAEANTAPPVATASASSAEPAPGATTSAAPTPPAQEGLPAANTGATEATEPEPEAEIPPHVLACMESVRATSFESELNEQVLLKLLRKNLKRIETWESWSEPAKLAFSHLLAAEVLHAQAAQIHIGSGIAFHPQSCQTYENMLLAVRVREPRRV